MTQRGVAANDITQNDITQNDIAGNDVAQNDIICVNLTMMPRPAIGASGVRIRWSL